MAEGSGVTEGMAGQSLTATAFAAIFSSLFATIFTRGVDRRNVVMAYSAMLNGSSPLAALGTSSTLLLVARVLLGIALGGSGEGGCVEIVGVAPRGVT
jgi:predicted MFS family arabinose efflux permease